jgi:hypothetical protein
MNFMVIEKGREYILFVPAMNETNLESLVALARARGGIVHVFQLTGLNSVHLVELDT